MTWTTERPTQSGWYWWREPGLPKMGVVVQVDVEAGKVYSLKTDADASLDQRIGMVGPTGDASVSWATQLSESLVQDLLHPPEE